MKKVLIDSAAAAGIGAAGYVGVEHYAPPAPDPVTNTLQIIIAVASVLGSLWTPIKGLIGLFKKK